MKQQSKNQLSIFSTLNAEKGYTCPCCGQFVKTYKRSFNCNMALTLIALVKHKQFDWVKIEDFLLKNGYQRCGDFSYLRHYEMLEKKHGRRKDGSKDNGMYKITKKGIDFANDLFSIPAYFFIFNNELKGFAGENIDVRKALGKKFSYESLMSQ